MHLICEANDIFTLLVLSLGQILYIPDLTYKPHNVSIVGFILRIMKLKLSAAK